MSEYDHHDGERERRRRAPASEAKVQLTRWNPWIWLVPAVAIFIAAFLVVRYGYFGGGDITVRFADARGLDRYSPVRFRGAKVGTVQKITIDQDLRQVVVRISMDASMNHALRKNTRFWIVEPSLEGGVGGLLSGTYVGIAPGDGDQTRDFVGQEYAPVLTPPEEGKTVILEAKGPAPVAVGAPIDYHGLRVGQVLGSEYDERTGLTLVHAFVVKRFAPDLRQSTRFWRAGGLQLQFGGGGVSMGGGASVASLLSAPIEFYTPSVLAGPEVTNGTHFALYDTQGTAMAAADGPQLTYLIFFPGPVNGLQPGTPVQMKGVAVGHVRDVMLRYVDANATLQTPVTIEIDPTQLQLPVSGATTRDQVRATMNDALAKLVRKGMRATLQSSLVLPGASGVSLDFVAAPNTGQLDVSSDPPIIPAAPAGGGVEGALAALNDIATKLRAVPIQEIAGHLRSAVARVDQLVHDPALEQSLQRLNTSLGDVEKVAATTRENVGPIVSSLRNAAASAEEAAARAKQLMGNAPRQNYDLGQLIEELTRAAQSVRALASYLDENPDALLKGRGKAK